MNNVQLSFSYKDAFERIRAEGAENVILDLRQVTPAGSCACFTKETFSFYERIEVQVRPGNCQHR